MADHKDDNAVPPQRDWIAGIGRIVAVYGIDKWGPNDMNRRQKNLMFKWVNESMAECESYGTDGYGDRPADMDICDYWLQHVKDWPKRVFQYNKLSTKVKAKPKPEPKTKPP